MEPQPPDRQAGPTNDQARSSAAGTATLPPPSSQADAAVPSGTVSPDDLSLPQAQASASHPATRPQQAVANGLINLPAPSSLALPVQHMPASSLPYVAPSSQNLLWPVPRLAATSQPPGGREQQPKAQANFQGQRPLLPSLSPLQQSYSVHQQYRPAPQQLPPGSTGVVAPPLTNGIHASRPQAGVSSIRPGAQSPMQPLPAAGGARYPPGALAYQLQPAAYQGPRGVPAASTFQAVPAGTPLFPPGPGRPQYPASLAQLGMASPRSQGPAMGILQQIRPGGGIALGQHMGIPVAGQAASQAPGLLPSWQSYQAPPGAQSSQPAPLVAPSGNASGPASPSSFSAAVSPPKRSSHRSSKAQSNALSAKKHCNCKNSRCLKLYCECFASGRYCDNCNCVSCCNNKENETYRQAAVETILDRNPNAFRPKIQPARHNKGCNCKKSGCLKKYCECFQASIYCSENCKCVDCKNYNYVSPKQMGQRGAPPGPGMPGSFTDAMNEAIAGDSLLHPGQRALKETMQEIAKGSGFGEMAKLLMLVAEEEAESAEQVAADRSSADQATAAQLRAPQQMQASISRPNVDEGEVASGYEAQERAILGEFHGFLSKLVKKVQRRTAEHEAAATLQLAASAQDRGWQQSKDHDDTSGQSLARDQATPSASTASLSHKGREITPDHASSPEGRHGAESGPGRESSEPNRAEGQDVDMTADEILAENPSDEELRLPAAAASVLEEPA